MDVLEAIHTRRSIRKFTDKPVDDETLREILAAAMAAPSAGNQQPWRFVIVRDRNLLEGVAKVNQYAAMAPRAPLGVLVCGDTKAEKYPGYWVIDCAAAVQNLLLAAHALGLGAVWTGVHPNQDRVAGMTRLFGVPAGVIPHSFIPIGWPAEQKKPEDRFRQDFVHEERF